MASLALSPTPDLADFGLPGWIYHDPEYHALEMERVIRPAWQIVCHVSDIPNSGDYETIEYLGESIVVVRGADRQVRAFSNVCRHRAMKIVEGAGCAKKLVCPYHAWTYELDGRLSGVPMRADYPALDMAENNLLTVDAEIWHGFVFVRLDGDGPSVAEMMAPAEAEVAPYGIADMAPVGKPSARPRRLNWKNVGDNYSDNLHIPVAHDGLTRLFGKSYAISAHGWVDRMSGQLANDRTSANFWERFYQRHLPRNPHLPDAQQRLWLYFKLWPNMAFDLYADQIDFMHWMPTGPTTCDLRVRSYALPSKDRTLKLVRYANDRINRRVNAEDTWLIERVQQGMQSRGYTAGPIGASEVCLRNFAARIRQIIPEARLPHAPPAGWSRDA